MQEERMKILEMVDEGKITVDEATKLLDSLGAKDYEKGVNFEEKFKDFSQDMKEFAKDVTAKINDMTKKAEPKIKEFTKSVVSKTANIADNISQSLNEKIKNMENCECECECACEEEVHPADNGPRPEDGPKSEE